MSAIESFNGLESDIIFIVLTENSSIEYDLYLAASRACEKVYIFNANINFSDRLRLTVDGIYNIHHKNLTNKIDIGLQNNVKESILEKYFPKKYQEYIDTETKNATLDKIFISLNFFINIFSLNQKIQIFNFKKENSIQKVAITHQDTNILLIAKQRIDANKQEYNSFFCERIIFNKSQYLLKSEDCFEICSYLSFSKDWNSDLSNVSLNQEVLTISELLNKIHEKPPITPVEETPEYIKWKIYLNLLEKSKIYKIDKIKYDKKIAIFKKPKNLNVKENDVLVYFDKSTTRYKIITFGEVYQVDNNMIYLKMSDDDDKVYRLELGLKGDLVQIKKLQNALQDIKYHNMRFYIFGDQKLSQLSKEKINIKFKNKELNKKQKEAIEKAIVSEKLFMIQGPPGTGKTTVISELAYQEIKKGNSVLVSSESNDAIENALEKILEDDMFYPVLYQSKYRQDQDSVISKDFPIESELGSFYKKRIIKNLKKSTKKIVEYNKEKDTSNRKQKERIKYIDDNGTIDVLNDMHIKELEKLESKYNINKNDKIFSDIQQDFLKELEDDTDCEPDLKEVYKTKINIVGATLNQIDRASRELLDNKEFDIALVDEVSKATPIELNLAILNAKKIILVGDQKQLPPMLDRDILEEVYEENYKGQDINKSQVRELYENETVFERLIKNNPHVYVQLTTQYRMHQDIQDAVNHFYEEKLDCGVSSSERQNKHQLFDSKNLVWIDTSSSKEIKQGTSFKNNDEKENIKIILEKLDQEYKNSEFKPSVGVISFYGMQVNNLDEIGKEFKNLKIDYGTVDTFQGQQRDFIIVSMVRSNDAKNIGFARSLNRINVAFSRAKQLLVILGSKDTFTINNTKDSEDITKAKKIYKSIFDISYKGIL